VTWKSKISIVFAGVLGGAAVSAPAAAAPVPTEIRVICPDLGQVTVAAPPRLGEQDAAPADSQVRVSVGYAAIDDRTGGAVAADPAWAGAEAIDCGTVPFAGKPVADVAAAPLPVGVRSGDRLTGRYQVSVRLALSPPAPQSGPMTAAAAALPFPNDGALSRYLGSRTGTESVALLTGPAGSPTHSRPRPATTPPASSRSRSSRPCCGAPRTRAAG
jgi:hypothetical protein